MHTRHVVTRQELIDAIWGDGVPISADNNVRTYVAGLRRALHPDHAGRAPDRVLVSHEPGYQLELDSGRFDAHVFAEHLHRSRASCAGGDRQAALRGFDAALDLWRGQPFAGISGPFVDRERARLGELRTAAIEERADVVLGMGRHADLVAELRALVVEYPLREKLYGLLMLALCRSGRQAEALAVYVQARRLLIDELGIEPGAELQRLHRRILAGDPD